MYGAPYNLQYDTVISSLLKKHPSSKRSYATQRNSTSNMYEAPPNLRSKWRVLGYVLETFENIVKYLTLPKKPPNTPFTFRNFSQLSLCLNGILILFLLSKSEFVKFNYFSVKSWLSSFFVN